MTITRREATWLSCKRKSCCYSSLVFLTGRDVWRISRALDVPPWSFAGYFQSTQPRPDAFILDRSGRFFRMALGKQPSKRTKSPPPCIFLMRTRDGQHRCGLGDLRPQLCKTFPLEAWDGGILVSTQTGCTCHKWSLGDVDLSEEQANMERRDEEFLEYCSVVARWNDLVASAPPDPAPNFVTYCNFLLDMYGQPEPPVPAAAEVERSAQPA